MTSLIHDDFLGDTNIPPIGMRVRHYVDGDIGVVVANGQRFPMPRPIGYTRPLVSVLWEKDGEQDHFPDELWVELQYGPPACPDCGEPIERTESGAWWRHVGLPGDCWRMSMDGPDVD